MTEVISVSLGSDLEAQRIVREWAAAGKHDLSRKIREAIKAYRE